MAGYGSVLSNGYRGDSQRAWKQSSSGRTYFLYSGTQLVCELSSSGTVTATNTVGSAGLISRHTSGGSVFYAFDTHGSVVQRLSSSGNILSTQTFDAYGSRLSTDGNADPYAGYQGQSGYYTDWETGTATAALALLTFRYYDPSAERFLTRDPIGYKGGANPYEYVNNNPTGGDDALGLFPVISTIIQAAGACAGVLQALNSQGGDTCNPDYNLCLKLEDCADELASAVVEALCEELGPVIAGCIEGAVSGALHVFSEWYCRELYHPCGPPMNWHCAAYGFAMDALTGCTDGFLGGLIPGEGGITKTVGKGAIEYILSLLGMTNEGNCDSFYVMQ